MKTIDIIRMCLRNLTKHKMRTTLTVTGVIIGTCAIIVMISLGIGMNAAQTAMLAEWADLTLVSIYNYGGNPNDTNALKLDDDVLAQIAEIEDVSAVTPFYSEWYSGNNIAVYSGDYMIQTQFIGVYMNQMEQFGYKLVEGRFATSRDPVGTILVGKACTANLYDYINDMYTGSSTDENGNVTDPKIDPFKDPFRIVPLARNMDSWEIDYSILEDNNSDNIMYGKDLNVVGVLDGDWSDYEGLTGIFVDISFMKELIKSYNELNPDYPMNEFDGVYSNVRVRVNDMNNVTAVEKAIQDMGFQTSSANEMRENMTRQTQTIQMMLGALAAISLFVAALNIMNTMIMSIVERTKEIGIMKVLGCDIGKIRTQFLCEAASIGFIGGVVGIGLSYLIGFIVNTFLRDMMMEMMGGDSMSYSDAAAGMDISVIPPWLALAALAFATVVGLVSGFYPANKGVKISALAAISHD